MLGNSAAAVVVVVVVVVRTRPRAIPLAMKTMKKSIHGSPFLSHISMGLRLGALGAAGAPLLIKKLIRNSIKRNNQADKIYGDCSN